MSDPQAAVAVIDIGSNSARVVCFGRDAAGHLRILAATRAGLRLVSEVDAHRALGRQAMERSLAALRDFRAIALGAGATEVLAVATAAMRDAADGAEFLDRVHRELGLTIRLVDGTEEARFGFQGGIRGLPVESGVLFDMGGGSMQLTRFEDRRLVQSLSLPLGALRLSQAFLRSDPPRAREVRALRAHVREVLEKADIPRLGKGEALVGTGGSIRNLAKIDRRRHAYPIARVHGYTLRASRLRRVAARLVGRGLEKRGRMPGLSGERADSIAGGSIALDELLDALGAREVVVSGMGVREGIAYGVWSEAVPSVAAVRESSIASLCARFTGFRAATAARRKALAAALFTQLLPDAADEMREALQVGSTLLDIGRSVDFYDRHHHTADIVLETELNGYLHRAIALISAVVRAAGDEDADPRRYAPLLDDRDWEDVERAAVLLVVADDIEERCAPGTEIRMAARVGRRQVTLAVDGLAGWRPRTIGPRFERVFGRALAVEPASASQGTH